MPGLIAKRELERVGKVLKWSEEELQIHQWQDAWGPGNVLMLELQSAEVTEVFTAFGIVERDNAIRAGATRAADKPMDFESLIDEVNELLNQSKDQ